MHCFAGIAGRNREGEVAAGAGAHASAYGVFQGGTVGAHIHAVGQRRAAVQGGGVAHRHRKCSAVDDRRAALHSLQLAVAELQPRVVHREGFGVCAANGRKIVFEEQTALGGAVAACLVAKAFINGVVEHAAYLADHPKAGALQDLRLAARVGTLNQRALNVLAFPIEADHIAELPGES